MKLKNLKICSWYFTIEKPLMIVVEDYKDNIEVKSLFQDVEPLNDRENIIPVLFNF